MGVILFEVRQCANEEAAVHFRADELPVSCLPGFLQVRERQKIRLPTRRVFSSQDLIRVLCQSRRGAGNTCPVLQRLPLPVLEFPQHRNPFLFLSWGLFPMVPFHLWQAFFPPSHGMDLCVDVFKLLSHRKLAEEQFTLFILRSMCHRGKILSGGSIHGVFRRRASLERQGKEVQNAPQNCS